jgi:hypothetical protein
VFNNPTEGWVKVNCFECGQEATLPYICPYCKQQFCVNHRLPENHLCSLSPRRTPLGVASVDKNPWLLTKTRRSRMLAKHKNKIIATVILILLFVVILWLVVSNY